MGSYLFRFIICINVCDGRSRLKGWPGDGVTTFHLRFAASHIATDWHTHPSLDVLPNTPTSHQHQQQCYSVGGDWVEIIQRLDLFSNVLHKILLLFWLESIKLQPFFKCIFNICIIFDKIKMMNWVFATTHHKMEQSGNYYVIWDCGDKKFFKIKFWNLLCLKF